MSLSTVFKPYAEEITVGVTPETVSNAKLVRIVNDSSSSVLVTVLDSSDETFASFTMLPQTEKLLQKSAGYSILATANVKAVPVGF